MTAAPTHLVRLLRAEDGTPVRVNGVPVAVETDRPDWVADQMTRNRAPGSVVVRVEPLTPPRG